MASRDLKTVAHGLMLVSAMLALIAAVLWFRGEPLGADAVAGPIRISTENTGVPDSGRQRQMILEELQKLSSQLKAMDAALRDGKYVVQTVDAKQGGAKAEKGARE